MNLLDYSEVAKTFDLRESVAKITSTMFDTKTYNIVLTENDKYKGVVLARDIAKRNITNPDKVEAKQFLRNINPISIETPIKDVVEAFVVNDYNTIPLVHEKQIRLITKLSLLNAVKDNPSVKKKKAKDLMKYPYCVSVGDSINTVISVMKEMSVLRVPVLSGKSKIEGMITNIDLLKADVKEQRSTSGEKYGEKTRTRGHPVKSIMDKKVVKARPTDTMQSIIEKMISNKKETVLIEDNSRIVGIITPKEVFKQVVKKTKEQEIEDKNKGVYIRISGIQEEDIYIKSLIDSEITNEIKKLGKILDIKYLVLHVTTRRTSGQRKNYSVKGKLITERGYYFAKNDDWDLTKAVRSVMNKFEREILKYKGKRR